MNEKTTHDDEAIDPRRTLLLGLYTTLLAIAFFALLIGDTVSAATF